MENTEFEITKKVPKAKLESLLNLYEKYRKQNGNMRLFFIPIMLVVAYHNFFVAGKSFYSSELDKIIGIEIGILCICLVFLIYNLVTLFKKTKTLKAELSEIHKRYNIKKYQVEEEFNKIATDLHGGLGFHILNYKERVARMKEINEMKKKQQ